MFASCVKTLDLNCDPMVRKLILIYNGKCNKGLKYRYFFK